MSDSMCILDSQLGKPYRGWSGKFAGCNAVAQGKISAAGFRLASVSCGVSKKSSSRHLP